MQTTETIKHHFGVSLKWDKEASNGVAKVGNRTPILFSPPTEFGGTDALWSPEHLLAASLASCYMNTFFYFAKLLKADVCSFHLEVIMDIQRDEKGIFTATKFILRPRIEFGKSTEEIKISNLLSKSKRYCIISNSVKGVIIVEPEVKRI